MKRKYILAVLFIGLLICGCDKTIEFNGKITSPMLVVSCFVTPDSVIKAELTKSRFFLDEGYVFDRVIELHDCKVRKFLVRFFPKLSQI